VHAYFEALVEVRLQVGAAGADGIEAGQDGDHLRQAGLGCSHGFEELAQRDTRHGGGEPRKYVAEVVVMRLQV
jgi:hypothetical protein